MELELQLKERNVASEHVSITKQSSNPSSSVGWVAYESFGDADQEGFALQKELFHATSIQNALKAVYRIGVNHRHGSLCRHLRRLVEKSGSSSMSGAILPAAEELYPSVSNSARQIRITASHHIESYVSPVTWDFEDFTRCNEFLAEWLNYTLELVRSFQEFEKNWNGRGAATTNEASIIRAQMLLRHAATQNLKQPFLYPSQDGGVVVEFSNNSNKLTIIIEDERALTFLSINGRYFKSDADLRADGFSFFMGQLDGMFEKLMS